MARGLKQANKIQISSCVRMKLSDRRLKLTKTLFVHDNEKFWKCQLSEVCWRVFVEHLRLQMTHFIDWKVEDSGPWQRMATHFSGPNVVSLWTMVGMECALSMGVTIRQYYNIPPPSPLSVSPSACLSRISSCIYGLEQISNILW